jgi:hypothetical protein
MTRLADLVAHPRAARALDRPPPPPPSIRSARVARLSCAREFRRGDGNHALSRRRAHVVKDLRRRDNRGA